MAALIFTDSKFSGQRYELVVEKTTVGRGEDNVLVIRDPSLSAHHCEILYNHPEVIVRDLGSRNGTVVNGTKLKNGQSQLKAGGTVRFGTVEARLELPMEAMLDEDTSETALFLHKKMVRDQRRAKEAPAADPARRLEPPEAADETEHTVLIPSSELTAARAGHVGPLPSSTEPVLAPPEAGRGMARLLGVVVLVAVALGVWWFLRGRR